MGAIIKEAPSASRSTVPPRDTGERGALVAWCIESIWADTTPGLAIFTPRIGRPVRNDDQDRQARLWSHQTSPGGGSWTSEPL